LLNSTAPAPARGLVSCGQIIDSSNPELKRVELSA
jgi:hypothetical protein